ncbi:MAG: type II toxin-antitoxin system death-on-curing family toxin [Chloroflexi bacterium]|nr:type II toxin-antitoxin system death-on-curing family toxin [Chloroflexota bacterium]
MEGTGTQVIVPTIEEVIVLNRRLIKEYGGGFYCGSTNLMNRDSLEHALTQMQYTIFGVDRYPTVFDKAALLALRIITGHVFYDGNKRTGMASAMMFLTVNGYPVTIPMETVDIALQIAQRQMTLVYPRLHWLRQVGSTSRDVNI